MSTPLRDARPLPAQLADRLRQRIADGHWEPGHRLPSEQELASEYGVSRPTVRSAVARLVDSGMLRVRHGAGTFVTSHQGAIQAGLQQLRSTSRIIAEQGYSCEVVYRSRELRPATVAEAERLEGSPGLPVIAIERCFLADDEVVAFEHDLINAAVLPDGVDAGDITGSVFEFMEPLGLLPVQAVAHVRAVHDTSVGWGPRRPERPLYVCLDQVQYLPDGQAVSWSRTFFVEDKFEFTLVRSR
ncbi:GntR family transcriptional regulator [Blastococcus deserti]|uniref:GntR family transcriptional regulator n=1 Tax=Blastococcus deserti TaxID=2259033 RepID=A0ABW4XA61_9ACTN